MLFPNGIEYDRKKDIVRTTKTKLFLDLTSSFSEVFKHKKSEHKLEFSNLSTLVTSEGFKPSTSTAVMCCTIQLCYEALIVGANISSFFSFAKEYLCIFLQKNNSIYGLKKIRA